MSDDTFAIDPPDTTPPEFEFSVTPTILWPPTHKMVLISDSILWDVDYNDEHLYLDRSPEETQALRKLTGINENYYLSIAEDLKDEEIEIKRAELRKLCSSLLGPA